MADCPQWVGSRRSPKGTEPSLAAGATQARGYPSIRAVRRHCIADSSPIFSRSGRPNARMFRAYCKRQRPHPVGGEGVGSCASMSAGCGRAMKPGGWIPRGSFGASTDGTRLLAARFLCGPPTQAVMSAAPCRPQGRRR